MVLRIDHSTDPGEWFKPVTELLSSIYYEEKQYYERPLLTLTSTYYTSGDGPTKYKYEFSRSAADGRLEVEGDQTGYVGYYFKGGPVRLENYTVSSLPTTNVASGDMLYCSNCTAPSTPCAGSGSGALALRVGGAWHCK